MLESGINTVRRTVLQSLVPTTDCLGGPNGWHVISQVAIELVIFNIYKKEKKGKKK